MYSLHLDTLIKQIETLNDEINSFNNDECDDIFERATILEIERRNLIAIADKVLGNGKLIFLNKI